MQPMNHQRNLKRGLIPSKDLEMCPQPSHNPLRGTASSGKKRSKSSDSRPELIASCSKNIGVVCFSSSGEENSDEEQDLDDSIGDSDSSMQTRTRNRSH